MSFCFMQNDVGPILCGQDVFLEVLEVDIMPDLPRHGKCVSPIANGVLIVVIARIGEGRVQQNPEAFQVPLLN